MKSHGLHQWRDYRSIDGSKDCSRRKDLCMAFHFSKCACEVAIKAWF